MDTKHQNFGQSNDAADDSSGSYYLESLSTAASPQVVTTASGATLVSSGATAISTSTIIPTDSATGGTPLSLASASALALSAMKTGPLSMLDNQLSALYFAQSSSAVAMSAYTNTVQQFSSAFTSDHQYVLVDTTAKDGNGATLLAELQALGLKDGSSYGAVASGYLPVSAIAHLPSTGNLGFARESSYHTNSGVVDTQADQAEAAETARSTYGVTGAGLHIGVLSDSFDTATGVNAEYPDGTPDHAAQDIANGDLPTATHILQDDPGEGTDEGRAMAQIIHDLAPGAAIDFATAYTGEAGFANNILALAAAGDKVIVDDVSYFDELTYQNGVIAQAVNQVASQGVSYFSSAGNDGPQGYEGLWSPGATEIIGGTQYTMMQFAPGVEGGSGQDYITVSAPSGSTFELQWSNPGASAGGGGATSDLDFFLTDTDGNVITGSAANNVGGDPVEIFQIPYDNADYGGTFQIRVGLLAGTPAPSEIRLIASGDGLPVVLGDAGSATTNLNFGTLSGHHGADGAIAVGAADFSETPAYGTSPPDADYYTSGGPQKILYDDDGHALSAADTNSVAFTAVDGGDTSFFGYEADDGDDYNNFSGTSAAAPGAASIALLLLQADSALTTDDIRALLSDSAIDIAATDNVPDATVGYDDRTGAGLIQSDRAVGFATSHVISSADQTTLYGTHLAETINGGTGDDTIYANDGNDTVNAGAGNDVIHGGAGDDLLYGNQGNDTIYGDDGNDTIYGGQGDDLISGGSGDDFIEGGLGNDQLNGGIGNNTVSYAIAPGAVSVDLDGGTATGAAGNDILYNFQNVVGSSYSDYIVGNGENNILHGGAGSDELHGGAGDDTLDGGYGGQGEYADTETRPDISKPESTANTSMSAAIVLDTSSTGNFDTNFNLDITSSQAIPHASIDAVSAGGDDFYAFAVAAGAQAIFDIDNNVAAAGGSLDTEIYLLDSSGNVIAFNDDSYSDPGSNQGASNLSHTLATAGTYYLEVGAYTPNPAPAPLDAGDSYTLHVSLSSAGVVDTGTSSAAPDIIDGGDGIDTATYASAPSSVQVDLGLENQVQQTGAGGAQYLSSIENIIGSGYADTLSGDSGDNNIQGGAGNDVITGHDGNDYILGNQGDDVIYGNTGDDYIHGGQGNDTLYGGRGNDTIIGGVGDDVIFGNLGADTLTGGAGADTFKYAVAADSLPSAPDVITDFETGIDKIDLSAVRTGAADTFSITTTNGNTFINVDLGGDGSTDMTIEALGAGVVKASDVIFGTAPASTMVAVASTVGETRLHATDAMVQDTSYSHVQTIAGHEHVWMV